MSDLGSCFFGDVTLKNNLSVNGNTILGNALSDTVTIKAGATALDGSLSVTGSLFVDGPGGFDCTGGFCTGRTLSDDSLFELIFDFIT